MTTTLQTLIFPEAAVGGDLRAFFHGSGKYFFEEDANCIRCKAGAKISFAGYFNCFSFTKWRNDCGIHTVNALIHGKGRFEIQICQALPGNTYLVIAEETVTLKPGVEHALEVWPDLQDDRQGAIYIKLRAIGDGIITGGGFATPQQPLRQPKMTVSITTFRREAQLRSTADRLRHYLADSEFGPSVDIQIVDNGGTADITSDDHLRVLRNTNLGGAGGFARGLLEAETRGSTHLVFIDDDASFYMENLRRSYYFLAFAKDDRTAVAGAMINTMDPSRLWEQGAVFEGRCQPSYQYLDLCDPDQVLHLERDSAGPKPRHFYGGWWFFAFPVAAVRRYPFPFFVRGDDVNFCLANDFTIQTLAGVASFQDDFVAKESPLNWYLDLRSHMVHHLSIDSLKRGPHELIRMLWWFVLRNLVRFQYESARAVLLAVEDVLAGPGFFDANADMTARRATLSHMTEVETWRPIAALKLSKKNEKAQPKHVGMGRFHKFTLNGHLLPWPRIWGRHSIVPATHRGSYWPIWGARRITYLNNARSGGYTTQISHRKGLSVLMSTLALTVRLYLKYPRLLTRYGDGYETLTSRNFWRTKLGQCKESARETNAST